MKRENTLRDSPAGHAADCEPSVLIASVGAFSGEEIGGLKPDRADPESKGLGLHLRISITQVFIYVF